MTTRELDALIVQLLTTLTPEKLQEVVNRLIAYDMRRLKAPKDTAPCPRPSPRP
jgi:hypothetical protein